MNPNTGEPVNPGGVAAPSNPLANLEGVVAAAKQEAAAVQTTGPVQPPAETPEGQFATQFGGVVPAVDASTPPEQTQPVETPVQPEPAQTPAEKLKQEIAASIDAFLEEVTKEKAAV